MASFLPLLINLTLEFRKDLVMDPRTAVISHFNLPVDIDNIGVFYISVRHRGPLKHTAKQQKQFNGFQFVLLCVSRESTL